MLAGIGGVGPLVQRLSQAVQGMYAEDSARPNARWLHGVVPRHSRCRTVVPS